MTFDPTALAGELLLASPAAGTLRLDLGDVALTVRSSSLDLLDLLRHYFAELVTDGLVGETRSPRRVSPNVEEVPSAAAPILPVSTRPSPTGDAAKPGTDWGREALATELTPGAEIDIVAIEAPPPQLPFSFRPWPRDTALRDTALRDTALRDTAAREPKEIFADAAEGRIVRKLRSGLCFLLTPRELIAIGPCLENPNQIINFILSQYTSQKLHQGWSLCHAAAVAHETEALAIAGGAGRGKSTLALHLLSHGLSFVSNDRLLIRAAQTGAEALGMPKMPRVNPGTLLHNRDLAGILPSHRRAELSRLAPMDLWKLEEKHDVPVDQVYGRGRTRQGARLSAVLILNWQTDAELPLDFHAVRLSERRDLLELLLKSPGAFHRDVHGRPAPVADRPDPNAYLQALSGVRVLEVTGKANFALAVDYCHRLLESCRPQGPAGLSGGGTQAGSMG